MPRVPARRSGVAVWRDGHALVVVVVRAALLVPRLRAPCACLSAARKAARNRFPISICRSWDNYRIPYGQIISALFVLFTVTSRKFRHIIARYCDLAKLGMVWLFWYGSAAVGTFYAFSWNLRLRPDSAALRFWRGPALVG